MSSHPTVVHYMRASARDTDECPKRRLLSHQHQFTPAGLYDINPYIDEINAASQARECNESAHAISQFAPSWKGISNNYPLFCPAANCTASIFRNPWCGAPQISKTSFSAASGLLGFTAFLQMVSWISLVSQSSEIPYLGTQKFVWETIAGGQAAAAFFSMVAWASFAGSGIKNEFCATLDPDEQYDGQPCIYADGFRVAVAASVLATLNILAILFWMPRTVSNKYEFSSPLGKSDYNPVGATGGAATDAGAAAFTGSSSGGGGYQDFGGSGTNL